MRRTRRFLVVCGVAIAALSGGCKKNRPPTVPQLSGPTLGKPAATLTYTFLSTDPENQEVAYEVAWGDTSALEWSSSYASGQEVTRTHSYADSGVYHVKVKARDIQEAESGWSDSIVVSIGFRPPNQPGRPTGPATCSTGIAYKFAARATHPLGDSVWFQFDWGDAAGSWGGPVASDSQFQEQHVFDSAGTVGIMVRVKDSRGGTSPWSEPLEVTVVAGTPPEKPAVSCEAISEGASLRLSWSAVVNAESYEIRTDDSTYTTTSLSFDVSAPTLTIEVRAANRGGKSDAAVIDCRLVETVSLVLFGISDPNANDASGLTLDSDGTAVALTLEEPNKAALDYVCDDVNLSPVGLVNAGDYGWPQNAKINTLADAGTTDYDALREAAAGGYISQLSVVAGQVYALWLSTSTYWTTQDHFCKAKAISVERPTGSYYKVTLKVGYQKIGGLRWLKTQ